MTVSDSNNSSQTTPPDPDAALPALSLKSTVFFLEILVFLILLATVGVFLAFQKKVDEAGLREEALKQEAITLTGQINQKFYAADEQNKRLSARIEQLSADLTSIKAGPQADGRAFNQDMPDDYKYVLQYLYGLNDPALKKDSERPVALPYYMGADWAARQNKVTNLLQRRKLLGMVYDGRGGIDTMNIVTGGESSIDGVVYVNFEEFGFKNGIPNTIYLQAPGLRQVEGNVLTIVGDKDIDTVVLDGCLFWTINSPDGDYNVWTATDIYKEKRTVKILRGTKQNVSPTCNNRYLDRYMRAFVEATVNFGPMAETPSAGTNTVNNPVQDLYGIGIRYRTSAAYSSGLYILDVVPEGPAFTAGMRAGDTIIKIDDQFVVNLNAQQVSTALKGPLNSQVRLSYIPKEQTPDKSRDVMLSRSFRINDGSDFGRVTIKTPPVSDSAYNSNKASGRPPGVGWVVPQEPQAVLALTPEDKVSGLDTMSFTLVNKGMIGLIAPVARIVDSTMRTPGEWQILPKSTCPGTMLKPGDQCTYVVQFNPEFDGQYSAYLSIVASKPIMTQSSSEDAIFMEAYAKGFAGTLPPQVLGNGDACPKSGTSSEVALSNGMMSSFFGYYMTTDYSYNLQTLLCPMWRDGRANQLLCGARVYRTGLDLSAPEARKANDPSQITRRIYQAPGANGPWKLLRDDYRTTTATVVCRNGLIEKINLEN